MAGLRMTSTSSHFVLLKNMHPPPRVLLPEHRSLSEIVLLHERPVLVHHGAIEIDRRLLLARQQRSIFDAADVILEGAFGLGDDRWILQAFHDRSRHHLGADKRAFVRNRGG